MSDSLKEQADLIFVMEPQFLKDLPPEKTLELKPFVGLSGIVKDPWPKDGNDGSEEYDAVATELREIIEENIQEIVAAVEARAVGR